MTFFPHQGKYCCLHFIDKEARYRLSVLPKVTCMVGARAGIGVHAACMILQWNVTRILFYILGVLG